MIIDEHTDLDQAWQEAKYITLWRLAFCYVYGKSSMEFAEWLWDGFEGCLFCEISLERKIRFHSYSDRCFYCESDIICLCRSWRDETYKFLPDIIKYYFNCLLETEV